MARASLQQIQQAFQRQQAKAAAERQRAKDQQQRDDQRRSVARVEEIGETLRMKRQARIRAALGR